MKLIKQISNFFWQYIRFYDCKLKQLLSIDKQSNVVNNNIPVEKVECSNANPATNVQPKKNNRKRHNNHNSFNNTSSVNYSKSKSKTKSKQKKKHELEHSFS